MEKNFDDDEIETNLSELLREFRCRIWIILGAIVLFGGITGVFSKLVFIPQSKFIAIVYILPKETTLTSLAGLQVGSQPTKDYKIIVTNRRAPSQMIDKMKLGLTYKDLKEKVIIDNPQDTRILSISVGDPDPNMAKTITGKIATMSPDYIGDTTGMAPLKLVGEDEAPILKSSPSSVKSALIDGLLGTVLICDLITVQVVMNGTIRIGEDVAKYLGLSVPASIPEKGGGKPEDREAMISGKSEPKMGTGKSRKKRGGRASRNRSQHQIGI